jgi:phospholipid/cholesterol/gamma-HCH transport system permease protein
MLDQVQALGGFVADRLEAFGRFTRFVLATGRWTLAGPGGTGRMRLLMPQLYYVGTASIPVVMLVGLFVGAVIGIESYEPLAQIGQEGRLGGGIGLSVVKQIGPVLAAVMIAGRVGGAVAAEIGSMRVTEQIDALRAMGADPIAYLVVPRVLACLLMLPVLTVFSNLLGVWGGHLVIVGGFGVDAAEYWGFSAQLITSWDVMTGLIKAAVFGLLIGVCACWKGFTCDAGAAGVGRATTEAFVTGFICIIVANFFLARFLNELGKIINGGILSPLG